MTRKEQIKQAEKEYSSDTLYDGCDYVGEVAKQRAFIAGAEWADKTMMEKICEWLDDIDFEMEYMYNDDGYTFFDEEKFIKDLRKTMEE